MLVEGHVDLVDPAVVVENVEVVGEVPEVVHSPAAVRLHVGQSRVLQLGLDVLQEQRNNLTTKALQIE